MDSCDGEISPNAQVEQLLEELRVRIFEDGRGGLIAGDPRAQTVYERIAERLQEPDETDPSGGQHGLPGDNGEASRRLWHEYFKDCLASIQRRSAQLDERGCPRVTCEYHSSGLLRHLDLSDWRGRHRARAAYSAAGEPVLIRLTAISGEEVAYTQETFAPVGAGGFVAVVTGLADRARQSFTLFSKSLSPKQAMSAQRSVEAVCNEIFPRVDKLLRQELEEGRQLVPTSEDLLEMSFEQILDLLAKAA